MFDFHDMTVIVTGSGAGMGREAAKLFAAYGANVVVNSRSASCEDARREIEEAGGSVIAVQADHGRNIRPVHADRIRRDDGHRGKIAEILCRKAKKPWRSERV